jgi:hypothetical protein
MTQDVIYYEKKEIGKILIDNEFSFAIIKLTFEKDIYEKELKTDKGTIMINKINWKNKNF